jgi:hypothetical protein
MDISALKEGFGRKEAPRQGEFTNNYSIYIYTYTPTTIFTGLCKCIWQIFTLARVSVKKYKYTSTG